MDGELVSGCEGCGDERGRSTLLDLVIRCLQGWYQVDQS